MNFQTRAGIVLLIVLSASQFAEGQQAQNAADQAREAVCRRVPCRSPTTVRLRLNNKEYFEMWPLPMAQVVISDVQYSSQK